MPGSCGCQGGGSCLCRSVTQHSSVTRPATHSSQLQRLFPAAGFGTGAASPGVCRLRGGTQARLSSLPDCLVQADVPGRRAAAIHPALEPCGLGAAGLARGSLNSEVLCSRTEGRRLLTVLGTLLGQQTPADVLRGILSPGGSVCEPHLHHRQVPGQPQGTGVWRCWGRRTPQQPRLWSGEQDVHPRFF